MDIIREKPIVLGSNYWKDQGVIHTNLSNIFHNSMVSCQKGPRASENRARRAHRAEAKILKWMNEWKKHFGL